MILCVCVCEVTMQSDRKPLWHAVECIFEMGWAVDKKESLEKAIQTNDVKDVHEKGTENESRVNGIFIVPM